MNCPRFIGPSFWTPVRTRFLTLTIATATLLAVPVAIAVGLQAATNPSQTNPVTLDVQLDKHEVLIADRIQLKVTASAPQGVTVQFPELTDRLGDFEVAGVKDTLDIPDGSNRKSIRQVSLESLITGDLQIPAIEISYVDRRGPAPDSGFQTTSPQKVTVRSTLEGVEDPTKFRDLKSVVYLPVPQPQNSHWVAWSAGAAGLLLVAAIAIVLVTRQKTIPSAKQWAIKSLNELKDSRALKDNDTEQIYVRVVSILRSFFQEQFGISAPRLTTDEFLSVMQADDRLSARIRAQLKELLTSADLVKFAGMLPNGDGLANVINQAIQFVENAPDAAAQTPTHPIAQVDTISRSGESQSDEETN